MSDEFGTVNMRRGDRGREIEVIRQQYKRQREALNALIPDAPTEYLASEYQRLIGELDASLAKVNELESPKPKVPGVDTQPMRTDPGKRPLVSTPASGSYDTVVAEPGRSNRSLLLAIITAAVIVLAILAWLMLRPASEPKRTTTPVVTEQPTTTVAPDDTTIAPAAPMTSDAPAGSLAIQPASHDFGVIRKGTRAVRQFELTNSTDQPITITVARSTCRCLYYSHSPIVPPKGKETITVTIDGARAKPGPLSESVKISAKSDASKTATMNIIATVR